MGLLLSTLCILDGQHYLDFDPKTCPQQSGSVDGLLLSGYSLDDTNNAICVGTRVEGTYEAADSVNDAAAEQGLSVSGDGSCCCSERSHCLAVTSHSTGLCM